MAKTNDASAKGELAVKAAASVPAAVLDYGQNAGQGFQNQTNEDVSIPFLGVLQPMSPQVSGDPSARLKGAQVGMLYNSVTNELFDGETGIIFQPVNTKHVFVEWKPRNQGGGLVAVHDIDADVVKKCKGTQEFGSFTTPAGNDLIETYYVTGLLHRSADAEEQVLNQVEPMVIAFTSTKIKIYKGIMTRLRTFLNGKAPLFCHRLRITTASEKNASGTFSNFRIAGLVDNDLASSAIPPKLADGTAHPLLTAGQQLCEASQTGAVKMDHSKGNDAGGTSGASGDGKKGSDIPF